MVVTRNGARARHQGIVQGSRQYSKDSTIPASGFRDRENDQKQNWVSAGAAECGSIPHDLLVPALRPGSAQTSAAQTSAHMPVIWSLWHQLHCGTPLINIIKNTTVLCMCMSSSCPPPLFKLVTRPLACVQREKESEREREGQGCLCVCVCTYVHTRAGLLTTHTYILYG
jgi:hypothetical protein